MGERLRGVFDVKGHLVSDQSNEERRGNLLSIKIQEKMRRKVSDLCFDACLEHRACGNMHSSLNDQNYGSHVFLVETVMKPDAQWSVLTLMRHMMREEGMKEDDTE